MMDADQLRDELLNFDMSGGEDSETLIKMINSIFTMSEESFAIAQPLIREEWAASINNEVDLLTLIQAINLNGQNVDDFNTGLFEFVAQLENNYSISEQKRAFVKSLIYDFANALSRSERVSKRKVFVSIKKLNEDAVLPTYGSIGAAAVDLYATEDVVINPGEVKLIPTGLSYELPIGYAFLVQPRSGLSAKTHLRIANTPGLCDSDYRGEIKVIMENTEPRIKDISLNSDNTVSSILYGDSYTIGKGERFAQLRLVEVPQAVFTETSELSKTARGDGGFGSTGK